MGFVCELFISGALSATYNINSGANPPDRVCRGAAFTEAASQPVGTKIDFRMSADNVVIAGKGGSMERLVNNDKGLIQVQQTLEEAAGSGVRAIPEPAVAALKKQVARDTTPGMTRGTP